MESPSHTRNPANFIFSIAIQTNSLSIGIDAPLYLCHVFKSPKDNHLGLIFSNPCDHAGGGGYFDQFAMYGFGFAHIPFPTDSIEQLDVEIEFFEYDLTESVLQSQRMFIQTERIYSDADCLHFINLTDTPIIPVSTCTDETGAPYQKMIHSPDERMVALFNDSGRVSIWDRTKREQLNYTSLDLLQGLHCDAATLSTQKDFNILCSNTLYTFDLNTDSLTHSVEFVTDVDPSINDRRWQHFLDRIQNQKENSSSMPNMNWKNTTSIRLKRSPPSLLTTNCDDKERSTVSF